MKLDLPQQTRDEAEARRWIGSGWRYPFTLGERQGELQLLPADDTVAQPTLHYYHSDAGLLALSDPAPLLTLLADCPALTGVTEENEGWYWSYFNQQLSPQIISLLGKLAPTLAQQQTASPFTLRLSVQLGEEHAYSQLVIPLEALQRLATRTGWQRRYQPVNLALPLDTPLVMGCLTLSAQRLAALRPADVLLPTQRFFTPDGQGVIPFAHAQFQGQLRLASQPGEPDTLQITLKEDLTMSHPHDPIPSEGPQDVAAYASDVREDTTWHPDGDSARSGLDALPLELTIRCGNLRLTLGELQQLDAGSTVIVEHVTPGEAMLCHGNFLLAKGELVNVNGSLGLQITNIISNQPLKADSTL
ncbi:type III secretion protein Q [Paramixta manurensis]|uniref:Type III secretion protein Q n=1 Tax=Paramixta manurensis TaxID=2740817 RepID=A0A6M8UCT3_9GAMM|nr:type III secretion protein Q [Erwiniaceae bacterium PD-1]